MGCGQSSRIAISGLEEAAEEENTERDPDDGFSHVSIAANMSPEGLAAFRELLKQKLEDDDDDDIKELISPDQQRNLTRSLPSRNSPHHRERFENICKQLHTGDLVFFHGGSWKSQVIRWFTFSEWSHVGIVLRLPGKLLLLESVATEDHIHDFITEKPRTGVRLINLLDAAFSSHTKYMAVLKIEWPDHDIFTSAHEALVRFIQDEHGKPYESDWTTLLKLVFNFRPLAPNQLDTREYYCSELVAEAYKHMDLLPSDFNSSDTSPATFFDINLRLKNDAHVLYIKYVEKPE